MPKDYKELYLKEKMKRINLEGELIVARHEKLMLEYEETKAQLKAHQVVKEEAKKPEPKKKTKKRKKS